MTKIKYLADKITNLNLEIKSKSMDLLNLKNELLNEMALSGVRKIQGEAGLVKLSEYKNRYSAYLKKEFNSLKNSEKKELYKTGVLKIYFRLNTEKYENFVKNKPNTPLDKFIKKRENFYSISVHLSKESLEKLKIKKDEGELIEISPEVEEILNKMEEERHYLTDDDEMNENDYDLSYFVDDDPTDLDSRERRELGLEEI
jgi:hypothetical protein|tara:strand:+ start:208 stop:810 length:603 start_codon:yes stop_codon:yes gene_type:complete